ncbi:MAG TPA: hypothetical protein DCS07_09100 [Bdellovibrionales bacterium]|nr:MAG: hypothetical protein A2Z97_12710 [Bdellovibrionales bacterium GWB1_52_6]OFZ02855.1 MAG: hypothetical protein A2X97_04590 [Bdellovibrionales bacterium GWA1_52_35]OFZ40245.1 MAG: hypothetical protein A2070_10470 [Bdellovibrionales bacterium GWC1_52_8]HAR42766.1 hypothetical protein [Bdellovibrionales bacterium]HCM38437.1 hypothetical protein [Bdellovibrionales bacterium]
MVIADKNRKNGWLWGFALVPILMLSLTPSSVQAGPSCPLSNPKYRTLSEAVTALSVKIKLPSQCAAKQASLQEATQTLSSSADQLMTLGDPVVQENVVKGKASAIQAISSLGTINSLLRDECAKTLLTTGDFLNAFIDTINAVTPYVLLFGGPAATPWAMGTMVTGSAIKTVIQHFAKNGIDMEQGDQRRAFIENACSYYSLNETVRSLIQLQQSEETDIQKKLAEATEQLKILAASEPPRPEGELYAATSAAEADLKKLKSIRSSVETVKDNGFSCFLVTQKISKGEFDSAGKRLLSIIKNDGSPSVANDLALVEYFNTTLNRSNQYDAKKPIECTARAGLWMNSLEQILLKTLALIDLQVKDDPILANHLKWKEQLHKKKKEIEDYQLRQKFLSELLASGAIIETSEILSTLSEVREIIFGDRGWGRKGLGQSWVAYKVRLSESRLKSFGKQHKSIVESPAPATSGQLADLCSQAEQARNTWYAADIHVQAGREFCKAFNSTINRHDYKYMQNTCFGSTAAGVRAQRDRVSKLKSEATAVSELMVKLQCKKPELLPQSF